MPAAVAPQNGGSYYLYNIGAQSFFSGPKSGYNNAVLDKCSGQTVLIAVTQDGYTIQKTADNRYLGFYMEKPTFYNYATYFTITAAADKTYLIQQKNSNGYLGYKGDNTTDIYSNLTEGDINWKFFTVEAGTRYCAELRLYYALEAMDGSNYNMDTYENIYANRSRNTPEKLNEMAAILEKAQTVHTNLVFPSYNEYPIFMQPVTEGWKTGDPNTRFYTDNTENQTEIMQGTVVTDRNATLMYQVGSPSGDKNEGTRLEVYIDKKLVRKIDNARQMNWNRRYYEEVGPGRHDIEWRYVDPQQKRIMAVEFQYGMWQ